MIKYNSCSESHLLVFRTSVQKLADRRSQMVSSVRTSPKHPRHRSDLQTLPRRGCPENPLGVGRWGAGRKGDRYVLGFCQGIGDEQRSENTCEKTQFHPCAMLSGSNPPDFRPQRSNEWSWTNKGNLLTRKDPGKSFQRSRRRTGSNWQPSWQPSCSPRQVPVEPKEGGLAVELELLGPQLSGRPIRALLSHIPRLVRTGNTGHVCCPSMILKLVDEQMMERYAEMREGNSFESSSSALST